MECYTSIESAEVERILKTMIHLLNSNGKHHISKQAPDDLNIKEWKKVILINLANDLKKLKEYKSKRLKMQIKSKKSKLR